MDISALQLNCRLNSGETLCILDVRGEMEFNTFNIGGINIPLGKLSQLVDELGWDKEQEVIVVCKVGLRSKTGKLIMGNLGYKNVKNLEGGLIALHKLNYKL
jgi:rhodanese-related sulfurtransferase